MSQSNYRRVIAELCKAIDYPNPAVLVGGGRLRIDDYTVSFIYDEPYSAEQLFVYVDMGMPEGSLEDIYRVLLKLNFRLGAGTRGVASLHPENDHVFYSFRFALSDAATGEQLLQTLLRFAKDIISETSHIPYKKAEQSAASIAARARASRIFAPAAADPVTKPADYR